MIPIRCQAHDQIMEQYIFCDSKHGSVVFIFAKSSSKVPGKSIQEVRKVFFS